jgi:hypothetical protein
MRIEDGRDAADEGQLCALFEGLDLKRVHSRRISGSKVAQ